MSKIKISLHFSFFAFLPWLASLTWPGFLLWELLKSSTINKRYFWIERKYWHQHMKCWQSKNEPYIMIHVSCMIAIWYLSHQWWAIIEHTVRRSDKHFTCRSPVLNKLLSKVFRKPSFDHLLCISENCKNQLCGKSVKVEIHCRHTSKQYLTLGNSRSRLSYIIPSRPDLLYKMIKSRGALETERHLVKNGW